MTRHPFLEPDALLDFDLRADDYVPKPEKKKQVVEEQSSSGSLEFRITAKKDSWLIAGVRHPHTKEYCEVELLNGLLEKSATKPQQEWISYSQVAHQKGNFYVPSAPLLFGLQQTLYDHRNDKESKTQVETIRAFLQQQYQSNWLWTLSQIQYQPNTKDIITHDVGLPMQYTHTADIKGDCNYVTKLPSPDTALENILGISDAKRIDQLGQWLVRKPVYFWRYTSSQITTPELCGVAVSSDDDWFNLCGANLIVYHRPSFGVQCNDEKKSSEVK